MSRCRAEQIRSGLPAGHFFLHKKFRVFCCLFEIKPCILRKELWEKVCSDEETVLAAHA